MLVDITPTPDVFDPRLSPNSPALTGACPLDDSFFEPVNYIGAFDAEGIWLGGWSGMQANQFFGFLINSTETLAANQDDLQVFPNPASETLTITLENATFGEAAMIQLYNLDGKLVQQHSTETPDHSTIRLSDIPAGMYLLQVKTNGQVYTEKLVINK